MPSPREAPGLWDAVDLGGVLLPPAGVKGAVRVTVKPKIKDDKKSPSGTSGGRNTTQGLDLADVEIELSWPDSEGQYQLVEAAIQQLWPPTGARSITHGAAALWGVRDVEIRSADGPDWKDGQGTIKLSCRQWLPAKQPGSGGGGSGGGAAPATAASALDAQIAQLEAQLKAYKVQDPPTPQDFYTQTDLINRIVALKTARDNETKTSTSSTPGTTWSQGGAAVPGKPSVPLGEVEP